MNKAVLDALKERRSIRSYKPEQITDEELNAVLEAGTYAPTGMGRQSPQMVVIQDAELIKKLSAMNAAVMNSDKDPFYGAPTAIIVLYDRNNNNGFADGSLVMGNLLNAAYAAGLGSCWINRAREMFDAPDGRALLREWGIDDKYSGVGICILGYAACPHPQAAPRKADYIVKI